MADGLVESRGRGSFVTGDALRRAAEHADEPVRARRARAGSTRARACSSAERPPRDHRRGRGVRRSRPAPSCSSCAGCGCSTACRSRSTTTGCRCASLPERTPTWTSARPRCTRRSTAPATRPAARTTSSRPAARTAAEAELLGLAQGAPVLFATTVAIGEDGRIVDLGRTVYRADRYRFQATLMRRAHRERETSHEERRCAVLPPRWRSPSPRAEGRRGRTSPNEQAESTPAAQVKTDGFEDLGDRHADASSRPRAPAARAKR